jgi:hypothetical protein
MVSVSAFQPAMPQHALRAGRAVTALKCSSAGDSSPGGASQGRREAMYKIAIAASGLTSYFSGPAVAGAAAKNDDDDDGRLFLGQVLLLCSETDRGLCLPGAGIFCFVTSHVHHAGHSAQPSMTQPRSKSLFRCTYSFFFPVPPSSAKYFLRAPMSLSCEK